MKSGIGYILILVGLGLAGFGAYALWAIFFDFRTALGAELYGKSKFLTVYSIWTAVGIGILFGGVKLVKSAKKANDSEQIT
jgi:hypothetical protein